jgi:rhamnosyltransferase
MPTVISVVIPVKNGGSDLERCLTAVSCQGGVEPVEILVVDSGSRDNSLEVARSHGARVYEIPAESFTHGGSRNLGASHATGDVLVFISQDAIPVSKDWLANLVEPLRDDATLAGVYGRQLAHEGAKPPEVYFLDFLYGSMGRRQEINNVSQLSMDVTLFSNVNSAVRRSVWEAIPFAEDIVMSEDQEWSRRALQVGYALRYEPRAAVRHSHNYTLRAAFQRFFDSGVSAQRAYLPEGTASGRVLRRRALVYAKGEFAWLVRTGQTRWLPYTVLYEATKMLGLVLGINHSRIPAWLSRRFSALSLIGHGS